MVMTDEPRFEILPIELTVTELITKLSMNPDTINQVCEHVASGGTAIDFANRVGIPYSKLMRIVRGNPTNSKLYDQALVDRDEWSKERLLSELRTIGTADVREAFDDSGGVKPVSEWPDSLAANVSTMQVFEEWDGKGDDRAFAGYTKTVKFHDKLKAIEMIGKNLKLWNEEKKNTVEVPLDELIAMAMATPHPPIEGVASGGTVPPTKISDFSIPSKDMTHTVIVPQVGQTIPRNDS